MEIEEFGDPTTHQFWAAAARRELIIQHCGACDEHQFYPRPFCLACGSNELDWAEAKGTGTVYSLSEVHMSPSPEFEAPYIIAIVELDEGPRFMTNIVNGRCEIGDRVRLAWRDRDGSPKQLIQPCQRDIRRQLGDRADIVGSAQAKQNGEF